MDRPFIHINCASTLDGKIARPDGSRLRISGPWDMKRVHQMRSELGAILVGAGTIIGDDPKLTVKDEYVPGAPSLNKIVIDGKGKIPVTSRFLRTKGRSIIVTSEGCDRTWLSELITAKEKEELELEIIELDGTDGRVDLQKMLKALHEMDIKKIMVEGGAQIIWEFVEQGLFDRFTIYYGPLLIGGKGPTVMDGIGFMKGAASIEIEKIVETPDGGFLVEMVSIDH